MALGWGWDAVMGDDKVYRMAIRLRGKNGVRDWFTRRKFQGLGRAEF